jgi:methylase of polypeptide subunit release factors
MFAKFMVPAMPDLAAKLNAPGGRMLDVGTGVAALAVAYAEEFPHLEVLGIDVMDRALLLAHETIAAAAVGARVSVRKQSMADFEDADGFDLAWVPAPFLPEAALLQGLPRVVATLRPGGLLMVGHGKFGIDPVADALTRFKTTAYGGTALDEQTAQRLLREQGLTAVRSLPTPPGNPAITIGSAPIAG